MDRGTDHKPDWFEEFKKANERSAYPLTPSSLPQAGAPQRERRRHPRFQVDDAPARIRQKTFLVFMARPAETGKEALDLSAGGAKLLAERRFLPGSRIRVRIFIERFNDTIEGDADVRWCRQQAPGRQDYIMGVMFTRDDPGRTRKIDSMRGYFTSPQFQAARLKRTREKDIRLFT